MIVTRATILYKCKKCGVGYNIGFTPVTQKLSEVIQSIDRTKRCTTCAGFMSISKAVFTTLKENYGDDLYGSWQCPVHEAFIYYPVMIRKAVRNKLIMNQAGYNSFERYKKIANDGYPWKCPHCGKLMKYVDDKLKHVVG